jgi:TP901 family phage tail tape measure protein
MAISKEYELLFMLKAQIDSAFGTGFSAAEAYLGELQGKVREYNAALRDVAAYQKQQQALDALKSKLTEEKTVLDNNKQSIISSKDEIKRLTVEKQTYQSTVRSLTAQITQERKALQDVEQKIKAEGDATGELTAEKQKHEKTIAELTAQKEKEQQIIKSVKAKLDEEKTSTKQLTAEQQSHEKEVTKLNNQITQREKKILSTIEALKKDGISTEELAQEEERLREKLKETLKAEEENRKETERLSDVEQELRDKLEASRQEMQQWQSAVNTITEFANVLSALKPAADLAVDAITSVNEGIMSCIESAGQLEYTMSGVQATAGATAEETDQLSEAAKYMGATTSYTASECAEALQTQALAGWSVEEMLNGLPAVVQLAAASQEDLNTMTGIVSDSLNAFGLSGAEAVSRFADVLAKTATSSNTTVSMLGESLSYVESTAANLGYSIEDVSVALAVMANNALKGSVSGSALNTMLTRMSGANSTAAKEMDKLGLSMYNITDESPKALLTFLNELRDAFQSGGMSAQEMQISAYKLAGQRGMRGLLSIVNTSQEEWEQMTADIYDASGAANAMSDIRLDNYEGQIYLLESAFDALKTTTGEAFIPAATGVAEVLTDICNIANDFVGDNQELIIALAAAAQSFLVVGGAIGAVATGLTAVKFAITTLGPEIAAVFGTAFGAAAIGAAVVGLITYAATLDTTSEATKELKNETDALEESVKSSRETYEQTTASYDENRESANNLIAVLNDLTSSGNSDAYTQWQIAEATEELNKLIPGLNLEYNALAGTLSATTDEMQEYVNAMSDDEAESKLERLQELQTQQKELEEEIAVAQAAAAQAQEDYNSSIKMVGTGPTLPADPSDYITTTQEFNELTSAYEANKAEIDQLNDELGDYIGLQESAADVTDVTSEQLEQVTSLVDEYGNAWSEAYEVAAESLQEQLGLMQKIGEQDDTSVSDIKKNLDKQLSVVRDYESNLQTIFQAATENEIDITPILDDLTSGTTDAMAAAQAIADSVSGGSTTALEGLVDTTSTINATVAQIKSDIADQQPEVQSALNNMISGLTLDDTELTQTSMTISQDIIQGLIDGLADSSGFTSKATEITNAGMDAIKAAAGTHSPSTITTEVGQNIDEGLIVGMAAKQAVVAAKAITVAQGAINAFRSSMSQSIFYAISSNAIQGAINGINAKKSSLMATAKTAGQAAANAYKSATANMRAYASGTTYAAPGWSLVGENGAELMKAVNGTYSIVGTNGPQLVPMSGGETVYTASETQSILANSALETMAYQQTAPNQNQSNPVAYPSPLAAINKTESGENGTVIQLTYAPVIQAVAAAMDGGIQEQLKKHDLELVEKLNQMLDEREASQRRRAY